VNQQESFKEDKNREHKPNCN